MLSKQLLTSLTLFVIFGAVRSAEDKPCIDAPPMEDFDIDEFYGHFYSTACNGEWSTSVVCLQYLILQPKDDGTCAVVKIHKDTSDNSTHMEFKNLMINSTGQGINLKKLPFTVVETDYSKYVVIFACDESKNSLSVSLMMGPARRGFDDFRIPQSVLDPYNINIFRDLTFINHQDCPTDWTGAVTNEIDFTYDDVEKDLIAYKIIRPRE